MRREKAPIEGINNLHRAKDRWDTMGAHVLCEDPIKARKLLVVHRAMMSLRARSVLRVVYEESQVKWVLDEGRAVARFREVQERLYEE